MDSSSSGYGPIGAVLSAVMSLRVPKGNEFLNYLDVLLAYQEELRSTELVSYYKVNTEHHFKINILVIL